MVGRRVALAAVVLTLALLGAGCTGASQPQGDLGLVPTVVARTPTSRPSQTPTAKPTATALPGVVESSQTPVLEVSTREWRSTNFRRYVGNPSEIRPGGPGRNGILPVYEPKFVPIAEAEAWKWMTPTHPVAVIERNGDARAYPLGIITVHEVVNDTVGGEPVLITYCPLCYTTIGFKRTVDGKALTFGTTGNVRNSNLIMWDDETESWWQQATGEAILGDMAGRRLEFVPVFTTSLREFKETYPQGRVLSQDSAPPEYKGYYGTTVYAQYDGPNNIPFLYSGRVDGRLSAMERVLVIEVGKKAMAFPFTYLAKENVIQTTVEGQATAVFWEAGTLSALDKDEIAKSRDIGSGAAFDPTVDGRVLTFSYKDGVFQDMETGSAWSLLGKAVGGPLAGRQLRPLGSRDGFWFVWAAFKPDIQIYRPDTAAKQ